MSNILKFSPKDPGESVILTFDFSNLLKPTEYLMGAVWSVSVALGVDANPSAMLFGQTSVQNYVSSHMITGGLTDVLYNVQVVGTTSLAQTLVLTGQILVKVQI